MALSSHLLVEIDDREKRPLLFPKTVKALVDANKHQTFTIQTRVARLDAGDYRLSCHPWAGGIERKHNLDELVLNLLSPDQTRFLAAWNRFLSAYTNPTLLVEINPATMLSPPTYAHCQRGEAYDALASLLCASPVPTLWVSSSSPAAKLKAGELVVRTLIQAALCHPSPRTHQSVSGSSLPDSGSCAAPCSGPEPLSPKRGSRKKSSKSASLESKTA